MTAQSCKCLRAKTDDFVSDLDFEEVVKRLEVQNLHRCPGDEPELLPTPQTAGMVVLSFPDDHLLA